MVNRPAALRRALRAAHTAAPEAATTIEAYLDEVERRNAALSAEDPYRALVLDLHATLVRVDSGLLADVARIEAERLELAKLDAQARAAAANDRTDARSVWKAVLSPPVLIVLLPLLLGSGGLGGLIVRYFLLEASP